MSTTTIKDTTINIPSKEIVTPYPPLTHPLELPKVQYAKPIRADQEQTQVTVLSNGLRVASENRFGQFCTIGVVIESGPRFEVAYPSGISHFLEKLAFNVRNFAIIIICVPHFSIVNLVHPRISGKGCNFEGT